MSSIDKQGRQVQRYANFGVDMMEWADGGYVRLSDYLALLDELEALQSFRTAFTEWLDKTEWVQSDKRFDVIIPWGKHRADVLKLYVEHLESKQEAAEKRIAEHHGQKRLIGWRMADYTDETADPALAKNWAAAVGVLPIFEGDANTKLSVAMLQGAEPVTTAYKLPDSIKDNQLNSGPDADEYYSGYQAGWNELLEAISGNSPVIPDGWVMVPVDMSPEMMRAVQINSELGAYSATNLTGAYSLFREFWDVAIAEAPQQEVK